MALLTQLSAHFQHEVQAALFRIKGRLSFISMMPSGQTIAQTPVLSHASVSIEIVIEVLRDAAHPKPRALVEPIQAAV